MLFLLSFLGMKKLLFIIVIVSCFSCQKEQSADEKLSAQNLTDVSYGNDAFQKMDVYLPAGRSTDTTKLIVMVHGGAWIEGDKSEFASFVPVLQQKFPGYAIANINYRLATQVANPFPAQENDMKAAVNFLIEKASTYHISQKIVLLGASAGAHMALLQAYKYSSPQIKAVVDFFGPVDMPALYNFYPAGSFAQSAFQTLMNGTPVSNPSMYTQSSPINYVTAQSPPTIIFHGTSDDVVPIAQSISLRDKLTSFSTKHQMISYPNVGHELWSTAIMNDVFNKIEVFVKGNVQ
jgi:acetyl esterase/lipase